MENPRRGRSRHRCASVDSREEPENVEVFIFPADEVRDRFNAARAARVKAGQIVRDNFGMWVHLDPDNRKVPTAVGSGIIDKHKRVAVYAIDELIAENSDQLPTSDEEGDEVEALASLGATPPNPTTIAQVMAWARTRVAEIAGVNVEAVKLDLKVEY